MTTNAYSTTGIEQLLKPRPQAAQKPAPAARDAAPLVDKSPAPKKDDAKSFKAMVDETSTPPQKAASANGADNAAPQSQAPRADDKKAAVASTPDAQTTDTPASEQQPAEAQATDTPVTPQKETPVAQAQDISNKAGVFIPDVAIIVAQQSAKSGPTPPPLTAGDMTGSAIDDTDGLDALLGATKQSGATQSDTEQSDAGKQADAGGKTAPAPVSMPTGDLAANDPFADALADPLAQNTAMNNSTPQTNASNTNPADGQPVKASNDQAITKSDNASVPQGQGPDLPAQASDKAATVIASLFDSAAPVDTSAEQPDAQPAKAAAITDDMIAQKAAADPAGQTSAQSVAASSVVASASRPDTKTTAPTALVDDTVQNANLGADQPRLKDGLPTRAAVAQDGTNANQQSEQASAKGNAGGVFAHLVASASASASGQDSTQSASHNAASRVTVDLAKTDFATQLLNTSSDPAALTLQANGATSEALNSQTAALMRAASTKTAMPGMHMGQPVTDQVALSLTRSLSEGQSEFRLRLHPAELGRVDVKMTISADGHVQAVLAADNEKTLNLLMRDQSTLERALQNAGLQTGQGSLNFSLNSGQNQDTAGQGQNATNQTASQDVNGLDLPPAEILQDINMMVSERSIDIRI